MDAKTVATVTPTIPPRKELLRRTLKSIFNQTRKPDQIIVEPDPDKTGSAATRNRANQRVITDYIAVVDDDDELLPWHIEVLMDAAERNPDVDVIYPIPKFERIGDPCRVVVNGKRVKPWGLSWSDDHRNYMLSAGNLVPHTVLMKMSTVREVGGYDTDESCDDYGLFRKILRNGGVFHHVPQETWIWRPNPLGHTGGHSHRWK